MSWAWADVVWAGQTWAGAAWVLVTLVAVATGHSWVNATRWLRRPTIPGGHDEPVAPDRPADPDEPVDPDGPTGPGVPTVTGPVSVLLPVRDEADRVTPCLRSLLAQRGIPELEIVVLDDGSTDGTADVVRAVAAGDPRLRLITGAPLPAGWLGKPYACQQLAEAARPDSGALVFVDADVVLHPYAVAASVGLLRSTGVGLLSPYPRIVAGSTGERLVQPLLQWLWLTFLPLRAVERSARPSLAAAGGQFLLVDRDSYRRCGGHAAVRDRILEDIELARAVKRAGGRIALADGSALASCRMYDSWAQLRDGYGKSLWAAFGPPVGAAGVLGLLALLYLVPPLLVVAGGLPARCRRSGGQCPGHRRAVVARRAGAPALGRAARLADRPVVPSAETATALLAGPTGGRRGGAGDRGDRDGARGGAVGSRSSGARGRGDGDGARSDG
jgi:hypothetical protein